MKTEIKVKGANDIKKLTTSMSKANKEIKNVNKNFDKLKKNNDKISKSISGNIDGVHSKFKDLTGSDALKRPLEGFNKQFVHSRAKGEGLFTSLKKGFGGVGKAISRMGGIGKFVGSIGAALGPLLLLTAAFYTLKTMFQANVGGMASSFYKLFGEIKGMIGQFKAGFIKALRKIGPLIKVILQPIINNVRLLFAVVKGVVKGLYAVIEPILDALGEIGKSLGLMGGEGKKLNVMNKIFKAITWTLTTLGKIIGWVVKISLKPLIMAFKILGAIGKFVWDSFAEGAKRLYSYLKPVFDIINGIVDWFKGIGNKAKEFKGKVEHKVGLDKVKNLFGSGENSGGTTNVKHDNRRISVFTNQGIDKNSFNEDSMVRSISG